MLELGVDEITLVLQLSPASRHMLANYDWQTVAENLIYKFEEQSNFRTVYGDKSIEPKAPSGYLNAYTYGIHNFYLAVAYHPYQLSMGILIKFSAQALDYYCENTMLKIYQFLQQISYPDYTHRVSRIDFTADYIDLDIDTTEIYHSLCDGKVAVFRDYISKKTGNAEYRKVPLQYKGIAREREFPTIYMGSVQSNSELRIYDKRLEQIERGGTKYQKAIQCKNWVRFEGVFKHEYAHQITAELMKLQTDNEFVNFIALTLSQKYRFMVADDGVVSCPTEYTQMLIDCITQKNFKLRAISSRNYELTTSIAYIFSGSGVMNTLYKLKTIWGMKAVLGLIEYIIEVLENDFRPNDDCRYWLTKNQSDYRKNYSDFDTFLRDNTSLLP